MKNKIYDCVEMKHRAAQRIHNNLKNMSTEEKLSYWNNRYTLMKKRVKELQQQTLADH